MFENNLSVGGLYMKCSIYLRNGSYGPSCYYRVMQYFEELEIEGLEFRVNNAWNDADYVKYYEKHSRIIKVLLGITFFCRLCLNRFYSIRKDVMEKTDIVVIQREVFPRIFPIFIKPLFSKLLSDAYVIWDFDDNILNSKEITGKEWKILNDKADLIIGISDYAKKNLDIKAQNQYIALPTTDKAFDSINLESVLLERKVNYKDIIKVVWLGTVTNLIHIDMVISQLELAANEIKKIGKQLELTIVCSEAYTPNIEIKALKINFVKWTREKAIEEVLRSHVGIMPLLDGEFEKGKGGFKLIQYLAASLPVIASDVGFNSTVVNDSVGYLINNNSLELWRNALVNLAYDEPLWFEKSKNARKRYESEFSFKKNKIFWEQTMKDRLI